MKILAIGAHPDDLEPQIGGTLAKFVSQGAKVLSVSATSTSTGASSSLARDAEGKAAANCLGASYLSLGLSPHEFTYSRNFIGIVDQLFSSEKPDLVFCVNEKDSHHEHQAISKCVRSASRKNCFSLVSLNQAFPGGVNTFSYNYWSDISAFNEVKVRAVMCYESQIAKYGEAWLEAVIARDKYWGYTIGCSFAEVANIDKWIS
ncbi:MAG: PIG-L family deacetylase [Proteobacteria bacterium]|nr:PIG-L family deacetylase [Pseudomonadota bacterium]